MPQVPRPVCNYCRKSVCKKQPNLLCNLCNLISHLKCVTAYKPKKISNEIDMNYICPQCFQSALPFQSVTDCEWNDLFSSKPSLSAASLNDLFSEMNIQNSWPNILDLQDELIENNILNDAYITAEEAKLLLTPNSSCENNCSFATLCLNARFLS